MANQSSAMTADAPRWFNICIGVLLVLLIAGGGAAIAFIGAADRDRYGRYGYGYYGGYPPRPPTFAYATPYVTPTANSNGALVTPPASAFPAFPMVDPLEPFVPLKVDVTSSKRQADAVRLGLRLTNLGRVPLRDITLVLVQDRSRSTLARTHHLDLDSDPLQPDATRDVTINLPELAFGWVTAVLPLSGSSKPASEDPDRSARPDWNLDSPVRETADPTFPDADITVSGNVAVVLAGYVDAIEGGGVPIYRLYNLDNARTLTNVDLMVWTTDTANLGATDLTNYEKWFPLPGGGLPPRHSITLVDYWTSAPLNRTSVVEWSVGAANPVWVFDTDRVIPGGDDD